MGRGFGHSWVILCYPGYPGYQGKFSKIIKTESHIVVSSMMPEIYNKNKNTAKWNMSSPLYLLRACDHVENGYLKTAQVLSMAKPKIR